MNMKHTMFAVEWALSHAPIMYCRENKHHSTLLLFPELQKTKQQVPLMIKKVGEKRWSQLVNDKQYRCSETICSRAFFKLDEIFKTCALKKPKYSVHLCESPGGFVQATATATTDDPAWKWWAVSLPSSSEAPAFSEQLPFDKGNVTLQNIFDMVDVPHPQTADLVTADGATSVDHNHLEETHVKLLVEQLRVALLCLAPTGDFVCKFFEGSHLHTRIWIAICSTLFESVSIIKPHSSRSTNSERYLVGRSRNTLVPQHFDVDRMQVSHEWMLELTKVLTSLANEQNDALKKTLARAVG